MSKLWAFADELLIKTAASRLTTFLRTAPLAKLTPAVEDIIGSAAPREMGRFDMNPILKFLRGGGDPVTPSITHLDREHLIKALRDGIKGEAPGRRRARIEAMKPNVEFGRTLRERVKSPIVTVSHGGTTPELRSILKYGPNSPVSAVPGVGGRYETAGLFVHRPEDGLAARIPAYGRSRSAYAGGDPAVLQFDVPERLLTEAGRLGGGEHVMPASLWRHARNPRITPVPPTPPPPVKTAAADPEQLARMRAALTQFLTSRGLPADAPHTVIAGGAMYGHGLRPQFDDVDVVVPGLRDDERVDESHGGLKVDAGRTFKLGDREMTRAVMRAATRHPSGLHLMSPQHILAFKQYMNRPKDQADIATLKAHLMAKKNAPPAGDALP